MMAASPWPSPIDFSMSSREALLLLPLGRHSVEDSEQQKSPFVFEQIKTFPVGGQLPFLAMQLAYVLFGLIKKARKKNMGNEILIILLMIKRMLIRLYHRLLFEAELLRR